MRVRLRRGWLYKYMLEKNISQRSLADKMGTSDVYLCMLFSGARYAGPRVRKKIAESLPEARWDELFYNVEDSDEISNGN